ncbi:uncharacterized protein MELLADRAFT_88112 [Melampsora larici-populina 98AG31]|uniref:Uncharacterized protein n=1 Tax=Melampsora larici-populina (strain 98AG31 / pathotype 3-4-7) TaxID=747676 RepID=F4SE26_MELLP|nr:uncharacterized protein MELLADRAFT_88112 [Melampsora larici-populina 98AG31]EGF97101.1 hypothetical protein MELLADRAFT_88112 [Melampsora larici-populina 98AG31]
MGNDSHMIALTVFTAQCYQNLTRQIEQLSSSQPSTNSLNNTNSNPTPTPIPTLPPWKPKEALKQLLADAVFDFIGSPELQAYTNTEGILNMQGQRGTLTHSLEELVSDRIKQQSEAWKNTNLPEVRAGNHTRTHKDVVAVIKKKCKIGRENLHHILLQNCNSKHGSTAIALPTLNKLLVLMADYPGPGKRTATDSEVLNSAGLAKKSRYAYLVHAS